MASLDSIKELYNSLEMYNVRSATDEERIVLAESDSERISTALQTFVKISDDEMPLLIYDNTLSCNGKEGFLLTNKNLYIGNYLETPVTIDLPSITSIEAKPKLISSVIIVNSVKINAASLTKKDLLQVGDFLQKVIPLAMQVEKPKEKPVEAPKQKVAEVAEQNKKEVTENNNVKFVEKKEESLENNVTNADSFDKKEKPESISNKIVRKINNIILNEYKDNFKSIAGDVKNENQEVFLKIFKKWDSIISNIDSVKSAKWLGTLPINDWDNILNQVKGINAEKWLTQEEDSNTILKKFNNHIHEVYGEYGSDIDIYGYGDLASYEQYKTWVSEKLKTKGVEKFTESRISSRFEYLKCHAHNIPVLEIYRINDAVLCMYNCFFDRKDNYEKSKRRAIEGKGVFGYIKNSTSLFVITERNFWEDCKTQLLLINNGTELLLTATSPETDYKYLTGLVDITLLRGICACDEDFYEMNFRLEAFEEALKQKQKEVFMEAYLPVVRNLEKEEKELLRKEQEEKKRIEDAEKERKQKKHDTAIKLSSALDNL